ncbi:MAG: 50S ribosome-binding GTPase, partial [Anaerolineae bacterium]|nr:50S ribosome-binding GTPase [Anaerolineae bacterium]
MSNCHGATAQLNLAGGRIALVGNPNVGKSILFHRLTGQYVVVSNYPGTTVEITQGTAREIQNAVVIDTPGIVAFPPRSEDEAVTARVLLSDPLQAILQVGDAKNLRRTLHLSVQLAEMRVPLALALNMMDEARARGLQPDCAALAEKLGFPVASTIATRGLGMPELLDAVQHSAVSTLRLAYPQPIETFLENAAGLLPP